MENEFEKLLKLLEVKRTAVSIFLQGYLWPLRAWMDGDWKHHKKLGEVMEIKAGARVLEVGVGAFISGFSQYSSKAGFFVGVDIDKKIIGRLRAWAKKNNRREDFMICDGTSLPFKDGSFDRVLFNNYTGNFDKSIREVYRVLKHKGRLYIGFATHPFYFRPSDKLISDIPKFWEAYGFTHLKFGWTAKTRDADVYYVALAEKK